MSSCATARAQWERAAAAVFGARRICRCRHPRKRAISPSRSLGLAGKRNLAAVLLEGPVSPMLATPGRALPTGDGWILEPKWDGWRALAHITAGGPRIFTRHGRGHHRRLPALNAALAELPPGTVL